MLYKKIWISLCILMYLRTNAQVKDAFYPLPSGAVQLNGYLESEMETSLKGWNEGIAPYPGFAQFFKTGRPMFAAGEMWGKAVRSGAMFYRYTHDEKLKSILKSTVYDLISSARANGSISCTPVAKQPDGPNGDLWERKYVLLGLDEYYNQVDQDPVVLKSMEQQADCIIAQIGPAPKKTITDQGWSSNHLESSTLLEPFMRLYKLTKKQEYLDFATYIVNTGGAKGYNIIEQAYDNKDAKDIGGDYPKAYEMLSLFEGVIEYYRVTGNVHWKRAVMNLFNNIRTKEITIVGSGGGDEPYFPGVYGEAWDNTALEQTNPKMNRMMETCIGVTWFKFCSQVLKLTGEPVAADEIEKYVYNGLLGAMKPDGTGFRYMNFLNGLKIKQPGWGTKVDSVEVTCCNLNGPMGLAYIPYIAVMNSSTGPVINLFNPGTSTFITPENHKATLSIQTGYPETGRISIALNSNIKELYNIKIRIPAWSKHTMLTINGEIIHVIPGQYANINRRWVNGDKIELDLDMRCRIIQAPHGSNRAGDHFCALLRGPLVLSRDENSDLHFNDTVKVLNHDGYVNAKLNNATFKPPYKISITVPTASGPIQMVNYAAVNAWDNSRICTWLPE